MKQFISIGILLLAFSSCGGSGDQAGGEDAGEAEGDAAVIESVSSEELLEPKEEESLAANIASNENSPVSEQKPVEIAVVILFLAVIPVIV